MALLSIDRTVLPSIVFWGWLGNLRRGLGPRAHLMKCPHGHLLQLPFPARVKVVAYVDDVTILVETPSWTEIKRQSRVALDPIREWGG
ncbi:hypothetical protein EVAR_1003_1 [Eumeta japonica]|uniref:Reverse transcriptase domain-containing protein n=1 Tax=Eumeta variegata TaxID=151549 RepID=A0A4C1SF07_EUMVA|nr:hypothetical protein EVAR_1003_1 [Eumeta japonica]